MSWSNLKPLLKLRISCLIWAVLLKDLNKMYFINATYIHLHLLLNLLPKAHACIQTAGQLSFISHISFSPISATIAATIPSTKTVFTVRLPFPTSANATVILRLSCPISEAAMHQLKCFNTHQQEYTHGLHLQIEHCTLKIIQRGKEGYFFGKEKKSAY